MTIFYRLGQKLYVNITNACPCACVFCIREYADGVGSGSSLWLEREPTFDEIKSAFETRKDLDEIDEIVFCGFGEPMERASDVVEICKFIKAASPRFIPIRINTNGLVRLIAPAFDISALAVVDSVSVSLNSDDPQEYMRLVNPRFGIESYQAMIDFAVAAKDYTHVMFTVVDTLEPWRIENCRVLADSLGIELRVRSFMP